MSAGYSGTPLLKKLGIKDTMKVFVINRPDNYYSLLEKTFQHNCVPPLQKQIWCICL
jgi:hypothetical protein